MAKIYEEEPNGAVVNVISAGTMITGDVVCTGDLRIDGNIKGNVSSRAKVVVGQRGVIDGDIKCASIEIEGNVKANISATDLLSMRSTSNLVGNITVGKLAIEPGANFAGTCTMQGSKNPTPAQPNTEDKPQ